MSEAKKLLGRLSELKTNRGSYESWWQDIRDLVRPDTSDFQQKRTPGDSRTEKIFDGTAPQSLEELASGLQSFLTPPTEPWFELHWHKMEEIANDLEALQWLQTVRDIIHDEYKRDTANLNPALQEVYLDLGAFGTSVLNQDDTGGGAMNFRAIPLADCYMDENYNGRIDTVFRELEMSMRQLIGQFGEDAIPERLRDRDTKMANQKYTVIHACYPRADRDVFGLGSNNMPFASVWILKGGNHSGTDATVLKESGYKSLPYHVPRWTKIAMETYGRGPAMKCLQDIKMLNRMEFTNIKAANKLADPPLLLPHDGYMMPIKTAPGSLNYKEDRESTIEQLPGPTQLPVVLEITNQKREFIRQCFFADWLRMEKEKIEMTAFEVQDRRDEKLRFLAPMLGRIMVELLSPMIDRSYQIMADANRFPEAPPSLQKPGALKINYTSPAAQAQSGARAVQMGRYIQEIIPAAQANPEILDAVDFDEYAQKLAIARGTPLSIIRSPAAILEIRENRQRQEQMAAMAGAAEPVSKAVKNIAEANEAGGIL